MIIVSNALTVALAHLQTEGAGHSIAVPASAWQEVSESIECWCSRRNLTFEREGRMVKLQLVANPFSLPK